MGRGGVSPKLKAPPERLHRSGHCNLTNPPHVHVRCRGAYSGARCPCDCHAESEPAAVPVDVMRFAYADPPYLGCCGLYGHEHPDGLCWDDLDTHRALVARLVADYPDGWAMSASSPSLRHLLPLVPEDVRVAAWVKPFHALKRGVRPSYGWEPVLFRGGRNRGHPPPPKGGKATTPRDFVQESITLQRGLTGAKPAKVCEWILDLLGHRPGVDTLDDLYPGTGIMGEVVAARVGSVYDLGVSVTGQFDPAAANPWLAAHLYVEPENVGAECEAVTEVTSDGLGSCRCNRPREEHVPSLFHPQRGTLPSLLADGSTRCPLCGSPWTPLAAAGGTGGASAKW